MGEVEEVVKLLWKEARQCSEILRETAKARSLRQPGNSERRTDLYAWPKPENTISGEAATMLTTLQARNEQLEAQLAEAKQALVEADRKCDALNNEWNDTLAQLAEARAETIERCAKVAELDGFAGNRHRYASQTASDIADAIRALAPGSDLQTGPIGDAGQ